MSLALGKVKKAICTGSELCSRNLVSTNFEEEVKYLKSLGANPYIAFEKDFLRWMLSDGAGALFLQDKPVKSGLSFRIDWIEIKSYANEFETCMYYGAVKDSSGNLIPWRDIEQHDWITKSVFAVKQDSALLEKHITQAGGRLLHELKTKKQFDPSKVTYFLPHISSEFFRKKIKEAMHEFNLLIPEDKWFTNLEKVGNIGSASGFIMLEELFSSNKLKKGDTILLMIPESARFSYTFSHLTVV
jgi:3-oxoacyl-[acyl-carrier-protein] synthase-3